MHIQPGPGVQLQALGRTEDDQVRRWDYTKSPTKAGLADWTPPECNIGTVAALLNLADDPQHPELRDSFRELAFPVRNCGAPHWRQVSGVLTQVPMRCQRHQLCEICASRRALRTARDRAARALLVCKAHPSLHFAAVTFQVPEAENLDEQIQFLLASQKRFRRAEWGGSRLVEGMLWNIEISRGFRGTWRAHLHSIFALRHADWQSAKRVLTSWIGITQPTSTKRGMLCALARQHWQPLHGAHRVSSLEERSDVVAMDVFRYSKYSLEFPQLDPLERLVVLGATLDRKLTGCVGVFRGLDDDAADIAASRVFALTRLFSRVQTDSDESTTTSKHFSRRARRDRWNLMVATDGRSGTW